MDDLVVGANLTVFCDAYMLFQRSVAEVEWEKTSLITTCRIGHNGKVIIP